MEVVRRLGAGPDRDAAIGCGVRDARVLFHGEVGVALVEEEVLPYQIGPLEPFLELTKLQVYQLVPVPFVGVFVQLGRRHRRGGVHRRNHRERFVGDVDQPAGRQCRLLVDGRHGGDRVADEPHDIGTEGVLVLADREDPEGNRQIGTGDDRLHPRQRQRPRRCRSRRSARGDAGSAAACTRACGAETMSSAKSVCPATLPGASVFGRGVPITA